MIIFYIHSIITTQFQAVQDQHKLECESKSSLANNNKSNSNGDDTNSSRPQPCAVRPKIELCFSPASKCSPVIVGLITKARSSIYVQAYGLTHPQIRSLGGF